jgi:hypothetical protein
MALRTPLSAVLALLVLGLAPNLGCDDAEELRAIDLAELPERFACEDVTVIAANDDGSEALLIGVQDNLALAAHESGELVEAEYQLPDPRLTVRWVAGSNVYAGQCGRDSGEQWRLDERHDAVSGHIAIRVTPELDGSLSVSAELEDLLLAPADAGGPSYELSATQLDRLPLNQ